ncbi:acyl-CoA dehydrogenase family protein [Salinifilum ghardaiensis]
MSTPDLLYTETEEDLRSAVRGLLEKRCDWTDVLARCEGEEPYDLGLWRTLAGELGLAGLLVDEEHGGAGAGPRELGVLAEEIGRHVAPVPFLGSVLTTALLRERTGDARVRELLGEISAGTRCATLAVGMARSPYAEFPRDVTAEGGELSGRVRTVVDVEVADTVVVPAVESGRPALYLVDTAAAGVGREAATPLDLTRRFGTLRLDRAAASPIGSGDDAAALLRRALVVAAGAVACEQVGLAQRCLDATVEYALTRYQFGRPIGSFQAVKHRLADLWTTVSNGRAVARNAVDGLAGGAEPELSVALARSHCSDMVVLAAEEHLQLHGGIGMTWEHPAHLYLGRAKSGQLTLGSGEQHRARIGAAVDLPPQ